MGQNNQNQGSSTQKTQQQTGQQVGRDVDKSSTSRSNDQQRGSDSQRQAYNGAGKKDM